MSEEIPFLLSGKCHNMNETEIVELSVEHMEQICHLFLQNSEFTAVIQPDTKDGTTASILRILLAFLNTTSTA